MINYPCGDKSEYVSTVEKLMNAADVAELVALFQGLPLYPHSKEFSKFAAEGIRSNITSVVKAVAWNNPYPFHFLDEMAWNQMILKCLFVGAALHPVYGLKKRVNPQLSRMLWEYARERGSAGRTVNPEIWELVAARATEEMMKEILPQRPEVSRKDRGNLLN